MLARRIATGVVATGAAVVLTAAPALAHDCFNPQKQAHAPTAGVNWELTGFDNGNPILVQVGPGKGIGGFIEVAQGAFGDNPTLYTYSLGALSWNPKVQNPHETVGGPGSLRNGHGCDGKGIDYIEVCYPAP